MKKLRRTTSTIENKNTRKAFSHNKVNTSVVIKAKQNKLFRDTIGKENIIIEESELVHPRVTTIWKKKPSQKKTKRSKSLIYDKKMMQKIDTTHNSSRIVELVHLKQEEIR